MGRFNYHRRLLDRRIRRTCYYSDGRPMIGLSLPLTQAISDYFAKHAPYDRLDFEYASNVSYDGAVSPCALIVAMIYLERMRLQKKEYFESSDPSDLLVSALLCASKFLYDESDVDYVYNDEWAASCSRSLHNVNMKEVEFLTHLEWDIMASEAEFEKMLSACEANIARKQVAKRGFSMYSDLTVLTSMLPDNFLWNCVLLPTTVMVAIASLTYTAAVFGVYVSSMRSLNLIPAHRESVSLNPASVELIPPTYKYESDIARSPLGTYGNDNVIKDPEPSRCIHRYFCNESKIRNRRLGSNVGGRLMNLYEQNYAKVVF